MYTHTHYAINEMYNTTVVAALNIWSFYSK